MKNEWHKEMTDMGIPVHIYNLPRVNSVVCGVSVNVGGREDKWPEKSGLAHAMEHMIFQGSRDFPTSFEIHSYIEDIGGGINAYTNNEQTFFYNYVPFDEVERSIRILGNILVHPIFSEEKIVLEKNNIIQEIKMYKDNPEEYLITLARGKMYGSHPLGRKIEGMEKSVRNLEKADFIEFCDHYYCASNCNFIVIGHLPQRKTNDIIKLFSQFFEELKVGKPNKRNPILKTENNTVFGQEKRKIEQMLIALMAPTCSGSSKEGDIVLGLFSAMISGGASFPLFMEVRDKLGLCYEISANHFKQSDLSSFLIFFDTDQNRYSEALKKIFEVINKSKSDASLLERAKKMVLGQLKISFDNITEVMIMAARQIAIHNEARGCREFSKLIESVTINDVQMAVDTYLKESNFTKVFLTPEDITVPVPR